MNNKGFFYSPLNQHLRVNQIFHHQLCECNEDADDDLLIYQEDDNRFSPSIGWSADKAKLFVSSGSYEYERNI